MISNVTTQGIPYSRTLQIGWGKFWGFATRYKGIFPFSLPYPISQRRNIIMAILTSDAAAPNSDARLHPSQSPRYFSQQVIFLLVIISPLVLHWIISCNDLYFSFLITRYSSFLHFMCFIILFLHWLPSWFNKEEYLSSKHLILPPTCSGQCKHHLSMPIVIVHIMDFPLPVFKQSLFCICFCGIQYLLLTCSFLFVFCSPLFFALVLPQQTTIISIFSSPLHSQICLSVNQNLEPHLLSLK